MANVVEVNSISKVFASGNGGERFTAVEDVSFAIKPGEVLAIVGRTGCGKSTLVNMMLGLDIPSGGRISIDGLSPSEDFYSMRGRLAAVFQTDRLLPWYTNLDNAALGLESQGMPIKSRREKAAAWLDRVGLAGWENSYPHQLSGGMRQRVAIARAFAVDPLVILLDEAFGHLDEVTAQTLRDDCMALVRADQKASIVVTHNITEALEIGTTVLVLGRPAKVLATYNMMAMRTSPDWLQRREELKDEIFRRIGLREQDDIAAS